MLHQRVHLLGTTGVDGAHKAWCWPSTTCPSWTRPAAGIAADHAAGRPVAVHAANNATVVLALAAPRRRRTAAATGWSTPAWRLPSS